MLVAVEFVGPMRRPWRERKREVEAVDAATIAELLVTLGYAEPESRHFAFTLNGVRATLTSPLAARDRLAVLLMVGGG